MNETDIEDSIREDLAGVGGLPTIVWPNDPNLPEMPFLLVEMIRFAPVERNLARDPVFTGMLQVSVIVETGRYNGVAKTHAEAIVAQYPSGRDLSAGGGSFEISRRPAILTGYREPALNAWRLPVQVPYRAFA